MQDGGDRAPVRNNVQQGGALQQRRIGRPSNVEIFVRSRQDPGWLGRLRGEKRERAERSNERLREKFDNRPLLALIVMLEERILRAHQTRSKFVEHVDDKRLTSKPKNGRKPQKGDILHQQLGGRCRGGPEWWLAELVAKHCLVPDQDDGEKVLEEIARMWCAANGRSPDPRRWPEPFEGASEQEIAALIDPPASSLPVMPAGTMTSRSLPHTAPMLAALLDGLPDALLLVDANGTIVTANSTAREVFDPVGTGLAGQGLLELLPAFDVNRLPRLTPGPHVPTEDQPPVRMAARRTDGTQWRAEVRSTHLVDGRVFYEPPFGDDAEGHSSYVGKGLLMVVARDLVGTQALQTELVRQQRQTEMILRTVSEGIVGVDTAGRIVLVNPAAAATLGYRASELGGHSLHRLIHHSRPDGSPLPYEKTLIAQTLSLGKEHRQRGHVLWTKDGRPVPVDLSSAPVHDGDQVVGAVMTFAVRQPLKMPAGLASRHALMLTLVNDELCAPLKDAHARLEELATDAAGQPEPMNRTLHTLASEHAWMNVLVRDVMDYQRLDSAEEELRRRTADLDSVVAAGVDEAKVLMGGQGVQFAVSASAVKVVVDPVRLPRALAHVLADMAAAPDRNGADEPDPRVSTFDISATLETSRDANGGSAVCIQVRGPERSESPVHTPLARGLIRLHGGTLRWRDAPDGGSVCTLIVPSGATSETLPLMPKPLWQTPEKATEARPRAATPRPEPKATSELADTTAFTSPLTGPYTLTSSSQTTGQAFETTIGTPVRAIHSGKITRAEWSREGYGIILSLDDGTDVMYHHLSSVARTSGQVKAGDIIGRVGAPQAVGDPHRSHNGKLGIAVRTSNGMPVDPVPWLREHGVPIRTTETETKAAAAVQRLEAAPTAAKPPTETMLTTRIRINIPGARSMPPIVTRTPVHAPSDNASSSPGKLLPRPQDYPRTLLVWPAPDAATKQALEGCGYRVATVLSKEEVAAQKAADPAALFIDPLTGPITRAALLSLHQAAAAAEIPTLVTAGLGHAPRETAYGAEPAVLLQALAPRGNELDPPRALLLEEHREIATALASGLTRRGMEVAIASDDDKAMRLVGQRRPNLVVLDLMYGAGGRPTEIIDWLQSSGQLGRTPLVAYTAANISQSDLHLLASGKTVLVLSERSTDSQALNRITDLLTRISKS